jgi:colanic acid/amylovoran biosynthesis glycosyltransferase
VTISQRPFLPQLTNKRFEVMVDTRSATIGYLTSRFPTPSETFVYREVAEFNRRGWKVHTFGLHAAKTPADAELAQLAKDTQIIYCGFAALLLQAIGQTLCHPLRTLRTLLLVIGDVIHPGEKTSLLTRAKLFIQFLAALRLGKMLLNQQVEHLHCHFAHSPTTVGMYAATFAKISFSFTGHANDLFERRSLLKRKLSRAAFVVAISHWHKELYTRIDPSIKHKTHVIRCGVDVTQWQPNSLRPSRNGVLRVLAVCRLVEKKGVDLLIEALASMQKEHGIAWKMTVAGDGPEREKLEALAQQHNCADSIQWLGFVDNQNIPTLLAEADLFSLACRVDERGDQDGIPVVLMEAMAAGVPVLCGKLPAIAELIEHDQSGLLVDTNDTSLFTSELARLANDDSLRSTLATAGRQRVVEEFSLSGNIDRLQQAITTVCEGQAK